MRRAWTVLIALGAMLAAGAWPTGAQVHRWVDRQGNVSYANRPPLPREVGTPEPEPVRERPRVSTPTKPERTGPGTVDEILELSGVKRQLVGDMSRLGAQFRPRQGQLSARDEAAINRIVAQAFQPQKIYALIKNEVSRQVDQPKLDAATSWFRSPVGQKIITLEIEGALARDERQAAEYVAELQRNPPPAQRVELLQRLDWVTGSAETLVELSIAVARSITKAVNRSMPPDRRLRADQLESQLGQARTQTTEPIRQVAMFMMLHTYRSLSDQELERYVKFLASGAGRWYTAAVAKAFTHAVSAAAERAAIELVQAVPPERWGRAEPTKP
jgi:hypothetical protein